MNKQLFTFIMFLMLSTSAFCPQVFYSLSDYDLAIQHQKTLLERIKQENKTIFFDNLSGLFSETEFKAKLEAKAAEHLRAHKELILINDKRTLFLNSQIKNKQQELIMMQTNHNIMLNTRRDDETEADRRARLLKHAATMRQGEKELNSLMQQKGLGSSLPAQSSNQAKKDRSYCCIM